MSFRSLYTGKKREMILLAIKFTDKFMSHAEEHRTATALRDGLFEKFTKGSSKFSFAEYEGGKPYIANSSVTYSLSHTAGCIVCAVSVPYSDSGAVLPKLKDVCGDDGEYFLSLTPFPCELGVDIEAITEKRSAVQLTSLAERCFCKEDVELFRRADDKNRAFFSLWTKNESIAKCSGEGLGAILARRSSTPEAATVTTVSLLNDGFEYSLSVCYAERLR